MTETTVSIVITTLNRCAELEATLSELEKLAPAPDEILVYLDGCTDGTEVMIQNRFAGVLTIVSKKSAGSIPARDTAFRRASGDLIVSLDDDSYPVQTDFVVRLRCLAELHPEAGAFAFKEIRADGPPPDLSLSRSPVKSWVGAYPNCAGAIRKEIYGYLTWYPRFFSHTYEEPDFCLQVYNVGYGVLYTPDIEIFHRFTHTLRNMKSRHHLNARNEFWSIIMRCPFPHLIWVSAYRIARQVCYGATQGWAWLIAEPKWIIAAFIGIGMPISQRQPVPWPVYWQWLRMARNPLSGDRNSLFEAFPTVKNRWSTRKST
jgi:GT2 family glycosyltransferase